MRSAFVFAQWWNRPGLNARKYKAQRVIIAKQQGCYRLRNKVDPGSTYSTPPPRQSAVFSQVAGREATAKCKENVCYYEPIIHESVSNSCSS
jgi:hypothetical protein